MEAKEAIAWKATQELCGSLDLETAMTRFFSCLQSVMPLFSIYLGKFDKVHKQLFVISRTNSEGTERLFLRLALSPEQLAVAERNHFFEPSCAEDTLITDVFHPLAPLYQHTGMDLAIYPLFVHRLAHENAFYGGGSYYFAPGTKVTPEMIAILKAVEAPLSIFINAWFQYWELQQVRDQMYRENRELRQQLSGLNEVRMIGANGGLKPLMDQIRQVAPLDVSVLIRGETGTGKEMAARAVHDLSPRQSSPFVAVNCGAIPPSLIDSELFGHAKGSFTGADHQHMGKFERAAGGTLFLDEVAELPLEIQSRLLRVLQERSIERVGGSQSIPVNFRLVAATHQPLERMVEEGTFREDLYYRLKVVSLQLPPLRERRQDIAILARHFLEQAANRFGVLVPSIPSDELQRLMRYDWPGNVRELQNLTEEALAFCGQEGLHFRLPAQSTPLAPPAPPIAGSAAAPGEIPFVGLPTYDGAVKILLSRALVHCHGKIRGQDGAAAMLGLNYSTMRAKLRKYGVPHGRKG